jgi:hypothetical protein
MAGHGSPPPEDRGSHSARQVGRDSDPYRYVQGADPTVLPDRGRYQGPPQPLPATRPDQTPLNRRTTKRLTKQQENHYRQYGERLFPMPERRR